MAARGLGRRTGDQRPRGARRGVTIVLVGVLCLLSQPMLPGRLPRGQVGEVIFLTLLLGGLVLIVVGWLLTGADLRPRGSAFQGVVYAAIAYFLTGLVWTLYDRLTNRLTDGWPQIINPLEDPLMLVEALLWPFQIAQDVGLFDHLGLVMGGLA